MQAAGRLNWDLNRLLLGLEVPEDVHQELVNAEALLASHIACLQRLSLKITSRQKQVEKWLIHWDGCCTCKERVRCLHAVCKG